MSHLFDTAYHDAWWAFLLAAVISFALMPIIRTVALRAGATAPTDERRVQSTPTPQVGGVGIVLALLVATVVFNDWRGDIFGLGRLNQHQLEVTLACAALVAVLGFVDDLVDLPWRAKLFGQVAIAVAAVVGPLYHLPEGLTKAQLPLVVNALDLPFVRPFDLPIVLGVGITVVWIVAVMNMLNFIDGVDGLAGGQVAIIGATFAIVAASYGRLGVAILAAATSGAALGFLPHNWRRGGARIFMGDSGALTLGFLIATISVQGVLKTTAAISLVIPLALLAVPIIDTSFVVLKRLRHGVSIASPDRWHLHHRLLNIGLSPRRVAATLWAWTASMSAVTLALRFVDYGNSRHWRAEGLFVLAFVTAGALAITIFLAVRLEIIKSRRVRERNRRIAAERAAERAAMPPASVD
ncbi:MAG: hypothetical protein JWN72_901 [Thermoleophilia bacterium]|nr:hypothetical protein [Thermoleophilia bacterium]